MTAEELGPRNCESTGEDQGSKSADIWSLK